MIKNTPKHTTAKTSAKLYLLAAAITLLLPRASNSAAKAVTSAQYQQYSQNMTHLVKQKLWSAQRSEISLVVHFNADYGEENRRAMKGFYLAYKRLLKKELGAELAFIDCMHQVMYCEELGINSFPRTVLISRGFMVDIPLKGRTKKLVMRGVINKVKKSGIELDDREKLNEIRKKYDRFFFYVGHDDEDFIIFKKLSAAYPFMDWFFCLDRGNIAHANGIYFYDEREGTSDMINGPHKPLVGGRMDTFTHKYLYLLRSLPDYAMDRIFDREQSALILFYPDTDDERGVQIPFWHGAMKVKHLLLTLQVPMLPTGSANERNLLELRKLLGVENPLSPALRIIHLNEEGRWVFYQLRDKITVESTTQFVEDWKEGKLMPFHRSERPERGHQVLKQLVGKNYKKVVTKDKYAVVSVIYSMQNAAVSKRALQVTKLVAKIMARFEYLRFVKIDAEYNSDDIIPQNNYPYIRLYPKGSGKEFLEYEGLYSAKELSDWVASKLAVQNPFESVIADMKAKRGKKKAKVDQREAEVRDI